MTSKEWGPGVAQCLGCGQGMLPDCYQCRVCLGNIHCRVKTFEYDEDPPGHGAHYLCKGCQEKGEGGKNTKSSASAAQPSEKKKAVAAQPSKKKMKAVAANKIVSAAKRKEKKKETVTAQSSSEKSNNVSMAEVVAYTNTLRCINRNCPLPGFPPCQICYQCGARCHISCSKVIGKNYYYVVCCPILEAVQKANHSHSSKGTKKRKALTVQSSTSGKERENNTKASNSNGQVLETSKATTTKLSQCCQAMGRMSLQQQCNIQVFHLVLSTASVSLDVFNEGKQSRFSDVDFEDTFDPELTENENVADVSDKIYKEQSYQY